MRNKIIFDILTLLLSGTLIIDLPSNYKSTVTYEVEVEATSAEDEFCISIIQMNKGNYILHLSLVNLVLSTTIQNIIANYLTFRLHSHGIKDVGTICNN